MQDNNATTGLFGLGQDTHEVMAAIIQGKDFTIGNGTADFIRNTLLTPVIRCGIGIGCRLLTVTRFAYLNFFFLPAGFGRLPGCQWLAWRVLLSSGLERVQQERQALLCWQAQVLAQQVWQERQVPLHWRQALVLTVWQVLPRRVVCCRWQERLVLRRWLQRACLQQDWTLQQVGASPSKRRRQRMLGCKRLRQVSCSSPGKSGLCVNRMKHSKYTIGSAQCFRLEYNAPNTLINHPTEESNHGTEGK
jgi:hypothetical protein